MVFGQFSELKNVFFQSVTVSIPQETKAANVSDLKQSNHQNIHEESKHHAGFSMKHHICSTVGSEVVDADRVKEDDLTQVLSYLLVLQILPSYIMIIVSSHLMCSLI